MSSFPTSPLSIPPRVGIPTVGRIPTSPLQVGSPNSGSTNDSQLQILMQKYMKLQQQLTAEKKETEAEKERTHKEKLRNKELQQTVDQQQAEIKILQEECSKLKKVDKKNESAEQVNRCVLLYIVMISWFINAELIVSFVV